jgi:hypothetical protein
MSGQRRAAQLHGHGRADGRLEVVEPWQPSRRERNPQYTKTQTIVVNRFPMSRDMHMFPYTPRATRLMGKSVQLLYGRDAKWG